MTPLALISTGNTPASQPAASRAAPSNTPEGSFGQVLNREMQPKPPASQAERARPAQQAAASQPSPEQSRNSDEAAAASTTSAPPANAPAGDKREDVKARSARQDSAASDEDSDTSQVDASAVLLAMIGGRDARAAAPGGKEADERDAGPALRLAADPAKGEGMEEEAADLNGKMQADAEDLPDMLAGSGIATKGGPSTSTGSDSASPFANALSTQQAQMTGTEASKPLASAADIPARLGTSQWDQTIGQRLVWMATGAQQSASLTLNPPELGPLQVVLSLHQSQANATFIAAQPEVRQALEAAMPRLREMLGDAGIQLGQASVNAGNPEQQPGFSQQNGGSGQRRDSQDESTNAMALAASPPTSAITRGRGLVDTFA